MKNYFERIKRDPSKNYDETLRRRVTTALGAKILVCAYIFYLVYDIVTDFKAGETEMSVVSLVISTAVLTIGAICVLVYSLILLPSQLEKTEVTDNPEKSGDEEKSQIEEKTESEEIAEPCESDEKTENCETSDNE